MWKRLTFVLFAAAILFSMVGEWSAPAACPRVAIDRATAAIVAQ